MFIELQDLYPVLVKAGTHVMTAVHAAIHIFLDLFALQISVRGAGSLHSLEFIGKT